LKSIEEIMILGGPGAGELSCMENGSIEEGVEVEVGLLSEGFNCQRIKGNSTVIFLDIVSAGIFTGIVGLKSRSKYFEVLRES